MFSDSTLIHNNMTSKPTISRSLNTNTSYSALERVIKKFFKMPEKYREQFIVNTIKDKWFCNDPRIKAFKNKRWADKKVEEKSRLSCHRETFSEKRRCPSYELFSIEQVCSEEVAKLAFMTPVRVLLSLLHHFNIDWVTHWMIEEVTLPIPIFLVRCFFIFPTSRKVLQYRVDISRLHFPIWKHQHIFYKMKNNKISDESDKESKLVFEDIEEESERIGPGIPLCFQSIRIKHSFVGKVSNVQLKLLLDSEDLGSTLYDAHDIWDRIMSSVYDEHDQ